LTTQQEHGPNWLLRSMFFCASYRQDVHTWWMFGWDERKRLRTIATKGVDLADVTSVLDDPARVEAEVEDTRRDHGERRFLVLRPVGGRLLHVTHTSRGRARRLISARKGNRREQRA
jgi:uncharacterized protein